MKRLRLIATATLLAAALSAGGCQLVGWAVVAFSPPRKIPPVYAPPGGKTVLVLVDDTGMPVGTDRIKARLTAQLNDQLTANGVAGTTIQYETLLGLAAVTSNFNQMGVGEIGQRLGADLVLYVQVDQFSLKEIQDATLWHGKLHTTIRWVDVQAAVSKSGPSTLWPTDRPAGQPIGLIETRPVDNASESFGDVVCTQLALRTADRIAKLFYEHKEADRYKAENPDEIFRE